MAEREELTDRLVESLVRDVPTEMQRAHLAEGRRRITEVEAGQVSVVYADEAMRRVRQPVDSARGELVTTSGFHPESLLEYAEAAQLKRSP